jgi:hypothetical protein
LKFEKTTMVSLGLLMAAAAAIACASGTEPTPQPTSAPTERLSVECAMTEIAATEPIRAVLGKDPIPTGFDSANSGTCTFSRPIKSITIQLLHTEGPVAGTEAYSQKVTLEKPTAEVRFPLTSGLEPPVLSSKLQPGKYHRVMSVTATGDDLMIIPIDRGLVWTPVYLVGASN